MHFDSNLPFKEPGVIDELEPLAAGEGPFRPNVAAVILRRGPANALQVLLGERYDTHGAWQWPQGGLDPGETPEIGLRREVLEEIGVADFKIIYRFPFGLRYRFPRRLSEKFKPMIGQEQLYFAIRLKQNHPPDLAKAKTAEFRALKWCALSQAIQGTVWFKQPVYQQVVDHLLSVAETFPL